MRPRDGLLVGQMLPQFRFKMIAGLPGRAYAGGVKTASTPRSPGRAGDLRDLLRNRLALARGKNPRYSLRSFARQLRMDHSTVSQVLRGKRPLSAKATRRIAQRLGLSENLTDYYLRKSRSASTGEAQSKSAGAAAQLSLDTFHVISDWHHYAILELTRLESFRADSRWLAEALGIGVSEVNIALQRLLRLGLLEMDGRRWKDCSGDTGIAAEQMTPGLQEKVRQQAHELALEAARRVPAERQEHQAATLAICSRNLPKLRNLVEEFLRDAQSLLAEGGERDDVYLVECSAFPLTNFNKRKGEGDG